MSSVFRVELLGPDALPQIEEIVLSRQRMGVHVITEEAAQETYRKLSSLILDPNSIDTFWGSYQGEMLCSFLVQTISEKVPKDWLMSYLTVNPKCSSPWNYSKNGLDDCWEAAFKNAEDKGRFTVRWSLPLIWARTQDRTKKTSRIWKDYTIETYSIVKAGDIPHEKFDQWIAGKAKPYDVALKKASKSYSNNVPVI